MTKIGLLVVTFLWVIAGFGQQSLKIKVKHADTKEPLPGATVKLFINKDSSIAVADGTGVAVFRVFKADQYNFVITHIGFLTLHGSFRASSDEDTEHVLFLEPEEEEEDEVVIQSTRSSRSIRNIPTRVEFIAGEELDEKANMKPGDIRMVLNESTGIMTQQTSATSANASIRIQGLDARYTQVLKDGFPVYAGFSSGLGLLQTPPLDLKQFEVIKGSASTLYGGGAIAGLVDLVSKTPGEERELKFHLDATTAGGLNTSGFYGQRFKKAGVTLFASRNSNAPYDPADIGLTAIPKFERHTVNPKFFAYFNERTNMYVGVNYTNEDRMGGDIAFIKEEKPVGFFEENVTERVSTQFSFEHRFGNHDHITVKNSFGFFRRDITDQSYRFMGTQRSSFTEFTYASHGDRTEWIGGINLLTDRFEQSTAPGQLNYVEKTFGTFIQNTWRVNEKFHIESGLRGDLVKDYGFVMLPRISMLFKFAPKLTSRVGGGLGYKTPNVFTEESERLQYRNVLPVNKDVNELERSYGVNADINFKTKIAEGEIDFSINHLFFYTRIQDPLLLQQEGSNYRFNTINGHIDSKGMETNLRLGYHDFKLFLGYTFTRVYLHEGTRKSLNFLTPEHRLNSVLLYEVHEKWKLGLEGYYFSRQQLSDGSTGRPYWITGFMAEKLWEKFSVYINFENFLDTRQTKFDTIYTGTIANPVFRDIYAPLDGFVVNGGIKLRL